MVNEQYELRIRADKNGAVAEIVKIQKEAITIVGSISTSSRVPLPILRFQPLGKQPFSFSEFEHASKKSLAARLKPSRFSVNLGFISSEWDLSSRTTFDQQEIHQNDNYAFRLMEHRKKLLRFYLEEFRNPARTNFRHVSFLRDFRYKNQILQHLKTGYPLAAPEIGLHETYTKWESLEKKSKENSDNLRGKLSQNLDTIGKAHNIRRHVQGIVGEPVYYEKEAITNIILTKGGLPDWGEFAMRKPNEKEDVYFIESSLNMTDCGVLGSANKPDDYLRALNDLVARVKDDAVNLRAEVGEEAQLDIEFQNGFQAVLDDAELTGLKGTCDKCPQP